MRKEYNKLVRDRIPEIIASHGLKYETHTLSEPEYVQALLTKLVEEAQEAASAELDDLLTELADLREVIDALILARGLSPADLHAEQNRRQQQRGAFQNRTFLLWTD